MTLLTEPTRIVLAKGYSLPDDADAVAYIAAVEGPSGDNQALEPATRMAINSFVKGCKADGIWPAIKASCILAGARTLAGALTPLVGTAPTNVSGLFLAGDYNRKTGLVGNGTTKYLNSNRAGTADPENSVHHAMYVSTLGAGTTRMGHNPSASPGPDSDMLLVTGSAGVLTRCRTSALFTVSASTTSKDFLAINRSASGSYLARQSGINTTVNETSTGRSALATYIFAQNTDGNVASNQSDGRLAFYSIGESLDLALLDTRVTTLINAFAAAIP